MSTKQIWIVLNTRLRLAAWLVILVGVGFLVALERAAHYAAQAQQAARQAQEVLASCAETVWLREELRQARADLSNEADALRRHRREVSVDLAEVKDRLAVLERQALTGRVFWFGAPLSGFGYMHAISAAEGTTWLHVTASPCEAQ